MQQTSIRSPTAELPTLTEPDPGASRLRTVTGNHGSEGTARPPSRVWATSVEVAFTRLSGSVRTPVARPRVP